MPRYGLKTPRAKSLPAATLNLDPASAYTEKTIALNYPAGAAKGAKLYIKFLSTNDSGFLTKSSDNLSFGSISRSSKHIGSQLYIDDITLNY